LPSRNFGPCRSAQDADRPPGVGFDLADLGESGAVLLMRAVAEIEAEDIDPRVEQRAQTLAAGARRPDRRDDLGAAQPPQRPVAAALAVVCRYRASTRMARKSLTLVKVGPVYDEVAEAAKNPYASFSAMACLMAMPRDAARARVFG